MQSQKDGLAKPDDKPGLVINVEDIPSPVLRRLVEEVRTRNITPSLYNRIHNRHNRGGG